MRNWILVFLLCSFSYVALAQSQQSPARKGKDYAVLFYVADYSEDWSALPETKEEVEEIAGLLKNEYGFSVEIVPNPTKEEMGAQLIALNQRKYNPEDQNACPARFKYVKAMHEGYISVLTNNLVRIEGGEFDMGDTFGDGRSDEKPVHKVKINTFYLGRNEVSLGEFRQFINATGYETDADKIGKCWVVTDSGSWEEKDDVNWRCDTEGKQRPSDEENHPVIHVSWNDAIAYCNWLSQQEGLKEVYTISESNVTADWEANGYRLPTEAEWEYAARSLGKKYKYAWGNGDPNGNIADETAKTKYSSWTIWEGYRDGYVHTSPVGTFPQGDLGLNDMTGNVWEWCWDWFGSSYYQDSSEDNPKGPSSGSDRVLRGGCWFFNSVYVRAANRSYDMPTVSDNDIGFRLSRTP